ncbi:GNAT family N-acetyltransferase [Acinetobacter haemolyticus]|uniref:GNAT family N-acetyltransferase n=1 Tax=Acinetobacter haemolyticus TaxID=29430 RepID=UPI0009494DD2|nr:GNAT family N-acetyltransferase [Acinetobacter haemolyticus]APR70631.1 GNAT family N-acetyltransferase [Acinetobacter haemolyticus]
MIVKRAAKEDLHQLAVLFDEYRQFYGASSNVAQSYQFLNHRFENKDSVIFIHVKDEIFTGFVLLYQAFSSVSCETYYILDDVYVTPSFRKQGSAKQLIDTAILFARHENAQRISLETQRNNYQSHQLYETMGFIHDNEFKTFHCFLK